ncbi:MAG TPA: hypothetical protein VFA21_18710, partial [Pyrinomonadaceae bacterium]|nr:hypothetical protein [Pyrinomonadaceae bacterium]
MKKRLATLLLISISFIPLATPRAQQPAEGGTPAWQVLQYDITVNSVNADGPQRSFSARAVLNVRNVGTGAGRTLTVRLNPDAKVTSASVGGATAQVNLGRDAKLKLQTAQLQLPSSVPPGGTVTATLDYQLTVGENSGLASLSPEGAQFLPLSGWYPTPNTPVAPRGADYAPVRISAGGLAAGDTFVSTGKAAGGGFEQALNAQPF